VQQDATIQYYHLNDVWKFSSNLKDNTMHLHYKEQPDNDVQLNTLSLYRIWGFHSGGYEEYHLLGYDAM
jgi:hypothetical protein